MSSAARIGIGGPVGSGKTYIIEKLIPVLQERGVSVGVVTNDLVTKEDADRLRRSGALPEGRVSAVEAGACPHTVIREDPSLNILAADELEERFPGLDLVIVESGGDNLASTFSTDLVDWWMFVIDVAGGGDIPRKRGPGVLRSDLLVVNKTDLSAYVNVDLPTMEEETKHVRVDKPYVMASAMNGNGIEDIADDIVRSVLFDHPALRDLVETMS